MLIGLRRPNKPSKACVKCISLNFFHFSVIKIVLAQQGFFTMFFNLIMKIKLSALGVKKNCLFAVTRPTLPTCQLFFFSI